MVSPASSPPVDAVTGNVVAVEIAPGLNAWVPVPEGNGTHRVVGDAFEARQINEGLSPVPASEDAEGDPTGWWDWDPTLAASITPNAAQKGRYNLLDQEITLARQANRYPVMASYQLVTPGASIKAKKILPHWVWRFTLKRGTSIGAVKVAVRLDLARARTD